MANFGQSILGHTTFVCCCVCCLLLCVVVACCLLFVVVRVGGCWFEPPCVGRKGNPIWANPFLAILVLSKTNFVQNQFWPQPFLANPFGSGCVCVLVRPKGWGPEKSGPERWRPKISRFFFSSPTTIFTLFVSPWGSSRGILVVFGSAEDLKCARLEFTSLRTLTTINVPDLWHNG